MICQSTAQQKKKRKKEVGLCALPLLGMLHIANPRNGTRHLSITDALFNQYGTGHV